MLSWGNGGALGGTRTPNLLIRSKIRLVQIRPSLSIRAAGTLRGDLAVQRCPCSSRSVVSNCVSKLGCAGSRSDIGVCPGGPACGGRAVKVKPAADAGPTAPLLCANTLSRSVGLGSL